MCSKICVLLRTKVRHCLTSRVFKLHGSSLSFNSTRIIKIECLSSKLVTGENEVKKKQIQLGKEHKREGKTGERKEGGKNEAYNKAYK